MGPKCQSRREPATGITLSLPRLLAYISLDWGCLCGIGGGGTLIPPRASGTPPRAGGLPFDFVAVLEGFPPFEELAPLPRAGCWPRAPLPWPFAGSRFAAVPGFGVEDEGIASKINASFLEDLRVELGGALRLKVWSVKLTTL